MDRKINSSAKVVLTRPCFISESNPQGTNLPPWIPTVRRSIRQSSLSQIDAIKDSLLRIDGNDEFLPLHVQSFEEKGRGVIATRTIPKDSFVCEYAGELLSKLEGTRRMESYALEAKGNYMFFFQHNNESFCIDATQESSRLGRLINHSRKNANLQPVALEFQGKATLVFLAGRNIPAGAELLYNYGENNPSALSEFPFLKN